MVTRMSICLSCLSILLGILALSSGVMAVKTRGCPGWLAGSLGCCCGALLGQLFELALRARAMDASAIYDTADAIAAVSLLLFVLTLGLNLWAIGRKKK